MTGTRIRYMGNKLSLSQDVAEVISRTDVRRPLIDLFAGMCSVAGSVSGSGRQVWVNDVQHYASLVGHCLLKSQDTPPAREKALQALMPGYRQNLTELRARFNDQLQEEREALKKDSPNLYKERQAAWCHVGNDDSLAREAEQLRYGKKLNPYRLAVLTFAWGYFGLRQSVEIDSLRRGADQAEAEGHLSADEAAWCRLALLQTCSRIASSPGHFAQFLRGNTDSSIQRIKAARRRPVWDGVLDDLESLKPFGTKKWRAKNRVTTCDALSIWPSIDEAGASPAIFYADPPYSKEQYSRFYHVLETLELYDYPEAHGTGRYRPDRFVTPLAKKSGVLEATKNLCASIAERDGTLLLSYPSTGLLTSSLNVDIQALLGEFFPSVSLAISTPSQHSTLGARHGAARHDVLEYVWLAT
jgi:adenine-specific DNA-methyltransferase